MKLLQKDVAGMLGVDTTTVNNWEKNRCQPRLYLFPKITRFLGYSPFPTDGERSLSEAIKAYRLSHGLSQKKLAKVLRIDPTTLARWEKGKATPSRKLSQRLFDLLGTSLPLLYWCIGQRYLRSKSFFTLVKLPALRR
jgi:transcriptional regulator with XRE-family HTH domain